MDPLRGSTVVGILFFVVLDLIGVRMCVQTIRYIRLEHLWRKMKFRREDWDVLVYTLRQKLRV